MRSRDPHLTRWIATITSQKNFRDLSSIRLSAFCVSDVISTLNCKYITWDLFTHSARDVIFCCLFLFNYILLITHKTRTPYCLNINKPVGEPQEHQLFQDCCIDEIRPICNFSIHLPAVSVRSAPCWISKFHTWTTADCGCPLALYQERK
jgi:hypothetical protein